jgi:hypothetical protein
MPAGPAARKLVADATNDAARFRALPLQRRRAHGGDRPGAAARADRAKIERMIEDAAADLAAPPNPETP